MDEVRYGRSSGIAIGHSADSHVLRDGYGGSLPGVAQTSALQAILERLAKLSLCIGEETGRVRSVGNRNYGQLPESDGSTGKLATAPEGMVDEVHRQIDALENRLNELRASINRIESL